MTHYAIDAANRIIENLEGDPSLVQLVRAFATGCSTLKRIQKDLAQDGMLRRDIEKLAMMKMEHSGAYSEALSNVEYFVNIFGQIEEEILKNSGASDQLITFLFHDVGKLLPIIREQELDPNRISNHVARLRGTVCDTWEALSAILDKSNNHGKLRGLVVKSLKGVAGAGIISANAAADIIALGPWASPVSGAVGGGFIGAALS